MPEIAMCSLRLWRITTFAMKHHLPVMMSIEITEYQFCGVIRVVIDTKRHHIW